MPTKPFLNYSDQLDLLEARGLEIEDRASAEHTLQHFNYYRISAYRFPFQDSCDQFREGTTFDELLNLYMFDKGLRRLVSDACKCLEISVRARWAYEFSKQHGAQAYENPAHFSHPIRHTEHLQSIDRELRRSHELFVDHYKNNYNLPRPPIWAVCEVMSFGLLSRFYENLGQYSLKKEISKTYDLSHQTLSSLLKHTSYLRNLCAHHSRLWNRSFTVTVSLPPRNPRSIVSAFNTNERRTIYNSLVFLAHTTQIIQKDNQWKIQLVEHLKTLNRPNHSEMGFPQNWQELPFWKI